MRKQCLNKPSAMWRLIVSAICMLLVAAFSQTAFADEEDDREQAEIEAQIERDALKPDKPRLSVWHACGDADVLKDNALRTRDFMEKIPGLDYHFEMLPGRHNWALWDEMASRFIRSLKLPEPEVALL